MSNDNVSAVVSLIERLRALPVLDETTVGEVVGARLVQVPGPPVSYRARAELSEGPVQAVEVDRPRDAGSALPTDVFLHMRDDNGITHRDLAQIWGFGEQAEVNIHTPPRGVVVWRMLSEGPDQILATVHAREPRTLRTLQLVRRPSGGRD